MRKFITACGGNIVISRKTEEHLLAHPEMAGLLPEAIARITLPENGFMEAEVEMNRTIGRSGRVETPAIGINEHTLFAHRIARAFPSRVLPRGAVGPETSKVVVLAFPDRVIPKTYVLITSWVGTLSRREPWDKQIPNEEERRASMHFWCKNALIYDHKVMGEPFESTWANVIQQSRCE